MAPVLVNFVLLTPSTDGQEEDILDRVRNLSIVRSLTLELKSNHLFCLTLLGGCNFGMVFSVL